jgi:glycosyltransferase involved in cell wall biosynthesis
MAAELPIVATPAGTATELLQTGRNGVIVPCADAGALARAVEALMDDVGERTRLGTAAGRVAAALASDAVRADFAATLMQVFEQHRVVCSPEASRHSDSVY